MFPENCEAVISITLTGSKGLREFRPSRRFCFSSNYEKVHFEWFLLASFKQIADFDTTNDDGDVQTREMMNLSVYRARKTPRVSVYDGGVTVTLPDKTITRSFPKVVTTPGKDIELCILKFDRPIVLPDEDFVIDVRIAYRLYKVRSYTVEGEDFVVCKLPSAQRLTGQVATAYEDLCRQGLESDFTFVIGEEEVKAHKVILSTRFPYFAAMISTGMVEATTNKCLLENVDAEAFRRVLNYIYSGNLPEDLPETAAMIFPLADRFNLPELHSACAHWMEKGLSRVNIGDTLIAAELFHCAELKKKCLKRLNQWKSTVSSEVFKALEAYPKLLIELVHVDGHPVGQANPVF